MPQSNSRAKSLYGRHHAVVGGHHLATRAAESVLQQGGSLIDAMIAASAVLTVTLPHTSSMGGCAMMLYFDAETASVHALNGSGRAPLAASPECFGDAMPRRGARACVTPTLVRFWARAHERFGRQPWETLFAAAIRHAGEGTGCPEELARNLRLADDELRAQPGFAAAFAPQGRLLQAGQAYTQPQVARLLREVASRGEDGFYRGWAADSLLGYSQANGGLLGPDDLAQADAFWTESRHAPCMGHAVHVMPPNSLGVLMLRQLQGREARAGAQPDMADEILDAIAAVKNLKPQIGDPSKTGPLAFSAPPFEVHKVSCEPGDTTGFVAMDARGNALAMLQSVFQPFGSGCVDPGTGVLLNNRMFDFSLQPDSPNVVAPGARPAHTLNPYLVLRDGAAHLAGVSPGGISQTTTGAQIVAAALRGDATLGDIVSRPRWSLGRDGTVLLEPGIPQQIVDRLAQQGLKVIENSTHEFYFGSAKVVRRHADGMLEAAADQRRQANATAW